MKFSLIKTLLVQADQSRIEVIATESGVPLPTLMKIKYGQTENPRVQTVEMLSDYLEKSDRRRSSGRRTANGKGA